MRQRQKAWFLAARIAFQWELVDKQQLNLEKACEPLCMSRDTHNCAEQVPVEFVSSRGCQACHPMYCIGKANLVLSPIVTLLGMGQDNHILLKGPQHTTLSML